MSDGEKKYDLIEKYLSEELSEEALAAFEENLKKDAELQKEVSLHRRLQEFITDEKALKLRNALADADRESKTGKMFFFDRRMLAVAASIIIIIFVSYFFLTTRSSATPEKLFAQNFEPYQMVLNSRSNDPATDTQNAAINLYQQGLFEKAIPYWTSLVQKDSSNPGVIFYRGVCFLSLDETGKARHDFESVINIGNPLFVQQGKWYAGLSYLQEGDRQKACDYFINIKNQDYKQREIQNILDKICK